MITKVGQRIKDGWYFLVTFFPIKLLLLHLRRSHILMIFWVFLFLFITSRLGANYGLPYLFLTPEYLDAVGWVSYFIVGATAGLFIMAFHISSYIYYSYRYTFLATLQRPLWRFSINNSVIPTVFIAIYLYEMYGLLQSEGYVLKSISLFMGSFLMGIFLVISFSFTYFLSTLKTLEPSKSSKPIPNPLHTIKGIVKKDKSLEDKVLKSQSKVNYYLKNPWTVRLARGASHYQKEKLIETIQQHHFSASIYFVLLIVLVVGLGLVSGMREFTIPAGASIFLIFSLYLMITGAFYSRLKTWTLTIGVVALFVLNGVSDLDRFKAINYAFGLDYDTTPAPYNYEVLNALTQDSIVAKDKEKALKALNNWRAKFSDDEKPKLILLNVSGGGLRSTLWAVKILQELDSVSQGEMFKKTHLITGSSGGMLGAAYYRELKYLSEKEALQGSLHRNIYQQKIAKDVLNPVAFTLAVNDLFLRVKKISVGGYTYPIDRGYAFDQKFNANTEGVLNHNLGYYREAEFTSKIPTMILGPTIVGDGRKLLIATQPYSFLTYTQPYYGVGKKKEFDAVEYGRLLKNHNPNNLSFITALRLSASFPYITPLVNLPTDPTIDLIDAGVRDNEGMELGLRYIYAFKDWIKENTGGIIIVQIKANRPDEIPIEEVKNTRLDQLIRPIGGVVKSFHNLQIYNKSLLMELSEDLLDFPVELVRFSLFKKQDKVSLSWHLTEREKQNIINTFKNVENQEALKRFETLCNE